MRTARFPIATAASPGLLLGLLLAAGQAGAQLHDGEWVSYRDAYRAMVVFEKYGGPKNFLQNQLQVLPRERAALGDGLQLTLAGKTTQLHLPLDPLGRTPLPLQKAAYDENAALVLNRKGMPFTVRPQVSIAARTDGVYDSADLRSACGQALGFARYADASQSGRQCVGARFVFAKRGEGGAHWRHEGGAEEVLPAVPGTAEQGLPVVIYRFGSARGQVLTDSIPLAILPVFE
jgi:hypothetical protein